MLALTQSRLLQQFQQARAESDRLFSILKPETLYERPIAERHRVIFYIGHLDGFDSIQICREGLGIKSPDPELDELFQAGIDPDANSLPADTPNDWPSIQQINQYVQRCRDRVDESLDQASDDLLQIALEHRMMHQETLTYMFHNFAYDAKQRIAPIEDVRSGETPGSEWCSVPGGEATLGKPKDGTFGWDNEYQEVKRYVEPFRVQRHKVTNGEYLRFVHAGAKAPHFWVETGSGFYYRGMFAAVPLPLDWPVYVSHTEAQAYATWAGKKLITEEQFHRAAYGTSTNIEQSFPWGESKPEPEFGNFDFKRWEPESVTATPQGDSAFGVSQLVGNGWEWTGSVFAPLPGFVPRPSYPGYSANFFDGEHYVMKGGSPQTAAQLLRRSFRNWFRHDYPYMYATFRCVE